MSEENRGENKATPAFLTWVKLSGLAAIALGATGLLFQYHIGSNPDRFGGLVPEKTRAILTGVIFFCLIGGGIASLFLRKSGLILVAVLLAIPGVSLGVGSIGEVPFPWVMINLVFSAGLLAPCWLVVKGWRKLRW